MPKIQLELQDKQAQKLAPYQDRLAELLDLGLEVWLERKKQQTHPAREQQIEVLAASGIVTIPRSYTNDEPYRRRTPVPINGKPVSELVIKDRGAL